MVLYTPPKAATHIPVIDLAPARDGEGKRKAAWEIRQACRDTGFFYVRHHGVPEGLIVAQFAFAARFFALPLERKQQLHMNHSRSFAGYEPVAGQTLDADSPSDLKESYYYSRDLPDGHPYVVAGLRGYGANQWPDELVGFREQMLAYHAAVRKLGDRLLGLLALSLGLPEKWFAPMYKEASGTVRLLRYPPHPRDASFNQLGAGAHTDWGGITLLAQDDIGGLEVQNAAGEWIAATPIPGTFVVNLGALVQRWTNDVYRSTMHRVLNNTSAGRDRYSVPFFYSPGHYARIQCLSTCTGPGNPPKYIPFTAGEHLMEMFNRTYGRKVA
jgi:isopenicillin N synthase-like dioxygenase